MRLASVSGIGVLVNPRSRKNRQDPGLARRIAKRLGDRGRVLSCSSLDELERACETLRDARVEVVALLGGDGTAHVSLTRLLRAYQAEPLPAIAPLRGGTIDTQANALGVARKRPEALFDHLVRQWDKGSLLEGAVERPVLLAGGEACFLFGTGALRGFIEEYSRAPQPNAAWAAKLLASAVGDVARGRPTPVAPRWDGRVTVDGEVLAETSYLGVAAGTVDQIGLRFRPFYRASEDRARFHLLAIHTTPLGFVKRLPAIWAARPMGPEHTHDRLAQRAVLEERGGVVHYMCDGDLKERRGSLELRVGPHLRIVTGRGA